MTEEKKVQENTEQTENFEKMLDESLQNIKEYRAGDVVEGKIIKIVENFIYINLGTKQDAIADVFDYSDKDGKIKYKEGDVIKGFIVKKDSKEIVVAQSLNRAHADRMLLREAFSKNMPVEGKIVDVVKGGYKIDLMGLRAFCPISQIEYNGPKPKNYYMNNSFKFQIIEYENNGRNIVVSRKKLIEKERQVIKKETLEKLEVGIEFDGIVTRITNFGAFIDLGGIDGLLHISEISWNRVEKPTDVLSLDQEVKVKVLKMEDDRISLSMKALEENPFDKHIEDINVGDVVECKIVNNEIFGSFAEIQPGLEGLIPISELSFEKNVRHPSNVVKVGDTIEVKIIDINKAERKITLSLKELLENPWDNIDEHAQLDDIVTGVVENITKFGVFVKIANGLTGLLPKSKIEASDLEITKEDIGTEIELKVINIDTMKKRISLEPKSFDPSKLPERPKRNFTKRKSNKNWKSYSSDKVNMVEEDNPFASL